MSGGGAALAFDTGQRAIPTGGFGANSQRTQGFGLVVDENHVYWTNDGADVPNTNGFASDGDIRRTGK
jgi:hypothetical protein